MVAAVVVVLDESADAGLEVAWQIAVLQQDAVLQGLMPTLDLALGLRMVRCAAHVNHTLSFEPACKIIGNVGGAIVARLVEDDAEAVRWYRLAAEQGLARAQSNLGVMYANGEGVPEDAVYAYAWLSIAAAQGDTNAKEGKDLVTKLMTQAQITEAGPVARAGREGPRRLNRHTAPAFAPRRTLVASPTTARASSPSRHARRQCPKHAHGDADDGGDVRGDADVDADAASDAADEGADGDAVDRAEHGYGFA